LNQFNQFKENNEKQNQHWRINLYFLFNSKIVWIWSKKYLNENDCSLNGWTTHYHDFHRKGVYLSLIKSYDSDKSLIRCPANEIWIPAEYAFESNKFAPDWLSIFQKQNWYLNIVLCHFSWFECQNQKEKLFIKVLLFSIW
jgi:hypothetical protein